jgi:hypothetical protein
VGCGVYVGPEAGTGGGAGVQATTSVVSKTALSALTLSLSAHRRSVPDKVRGLSSYRNGERGQGRQEDGGGSLRQRRPPIPSEEAGGRSRSVAPAHVGRDSKEENQECWFWSHYVYRLAMPQRYGHDPAHLTRRAGRGTCGRWGEARAGAGSRGPSRAGEGEGVDMTETSSPLSRRRKDAEQRKRGEGNP